MDEALNTSVEATEPLTVTGGEPGRQHYLSPGASSIAGQLPSGYLDPSTGEHYQQFILREMSGREEKILAGKGFFTNQINQVLRQCLESLGPIADPQRLSNAVFNLPQSDIEALTITLRRLSVGDWLTLEPLCPVETCRHKGMRRVNLADLEMKPIADPLHHHVKHTLSSGRVIQWHVLRACDSEWVAGLTKKQREQELLNVLLLSRIESVDGVELLRDRNNIAQAIQQLDASLTFKDRREFEQIIDDYEGDIDREVILECDECGHEWTITLPVMHASFFFRSGT